MTGRPETTDESDDDLPPLAPSLIRQNAVTSGINENGDVVYVTRSPSPAGSIITATDLGELHRIVEERRRGGNGSNQGSNR